MTEKDLCEMSLRPPIVDLRKISIVTKFKKGLSEYPKPDPGKNFIVYYGQEEGEEIKELGKGSGGIIYVVQWKNKDVIVKYPLQEPDYEPDRIEEILEGYHHNIIPYKIIQDQHGNPFIVMQQATGDVYQLLKRKPSIYFREQMIAHYAKAIGNLWRKRIVFSDMKAENLLYHCHSYDNKMSLYFGDIGAFSREGDDDFYHEVLPPEGGKIMDKNFCLFTLGLLVISIFGFDYKRPENNDYMEKFYNPLSKQISSYVRNRKMRNMTLRLISPHREDRDLLSVREAIDALT